jgi:CubicO group peptidase (beta-lactamase class C family)
MFIFKKTNRQIMKKILLGCLIALSFQLTNTFVSKAQEKESASLRSKLDEYIRRYAQNGDFSGNVFILKGNNVLFSASYGKANFELNAPILTDSKFRIASVSKTFTAAGIVLLKNQGRLSLSDKLSKFIPDFIMADSITVEELLLHRSGIADIEYDKYALDNVPMVDIINSIKNKPLYFKPGSRSKYSNSGYLILAAIIEKVSGMSYGQFLTDNIFNKIGMSNTGTETNGEIVPGKVTGYAIGEGANGIASASWYNIDLETGSGSLYSTTGDLCKWLVAIKNNTLFDISSLEYPFGWGKREYFKGKPSIEQSGFLSGYTSYAAIYPSEDLVVVTLSNISSNFNEQSGRDLAAICFNADYKLPELRQKTIVSGLVEYTGKYSWPGYKNFVIEQKGNTIYWRFTDEKAASPLAPINKDSFLLRLSNNKILFKRDVNDKVIALSFSNGNNETTCARISD